MALINSFEVVEKYIPEPNEQFYMGVFARLPEKIVSQSNICAILVDEINKKVVDAFRAEFILFSSNSVNYLFVNNFGKDLTATSRYVKAEIPKTKELIKEDWPFLVDEIGLYLIAGNRHKEKIYFATDISDVETIKKKIENKATLVIETVYV